MARDDLLVRTLVELAEGPTVDIDVVDYLTRLSQRAVELLAVDEAGVLLADASGTLRLVAALRDAGPHGCPPGHLAEVPSPSRVWSHEDGWWLRKRFGCGST